MTCRLLNLLTALSLLLCVAVVGLWVRSYWVRDAVGRITHLSEHNVRWIGAESESGALSVGATEMTNPDPVNLRILEDARSTRTTTWERDRAVRDKWLRNLAPQLIRETYPVAGGAFKGTDVLVPHCVLVGITAVAPIQWARLRRRRRRHDGLCPACGYDLRATPHRCPECATPHADPPLARGLARRSTARDPA